MRTRENSVVVSLRVERTAQTEFNALAAELGVLPSRKLREIFNETMTKMREQANEKRLANGKPSWESDYDSGAR